MSASSFSASPLIVRLSLLLAVLLTSCVAPVAKPKSLPQLMVERMSWMDEVAQVKYARSLPVTDPKREAELLNAMVLAGAGQGLPADAVHAFFSGQIDAAKVFQREWIDQHAGQPPMSAAALPDLATTVRPALDSIGKKMLRALVVARKSRTPEEISSAARLQLTRADYSPAVIRPALKGLETALKN